MTATLTVSGQNTTVTFTYVGPNAILQGVAEGACHALFMRGMYYPLRTYASLTLAEKLVILDKFVAKAFSNLAKEDKVSEDVEAARIASQAAADETLTIP